MKIFSAGRGSRLFRLALDGAGYLLQADIMRLFIEDRTLDYFMYDAFPGAGPGMRNFKQRIGFKPYRVRYSIDKKL